MGTTAQKGAYTLQTKSLLKQAINNIGGEVTDETTFRQYVNQLENAYDRLPKTEFEEGENITLENTLKGKLDYDNGVVGIGQASQESTQGYNLINFSSNQGSIVTVNGDGTITLNGTSSGFSINFTQVTFEANKTYSLFYKLISGTTNAGGSNVGLLSLFGDGSWVENNVRHSYTPEANTNRSTLWVAQNVVFTNAKFQIWAYEGNTDKPFERYSNNQASPSPNWKQPIKCVAGRNILDESLLETGNIDETTGQDVGNQYRKRSPYIEVDKNQPYTLSVQVSADIYLIAYFYNNQKTFISSSAKIGKQATYVLPSTTEYMRVVIANTSTTTATNIQLEEGTQATPYLPYNTIEEVVNLFDGDVEQGAISAIFGGTYAQCKVNNTTRIRTKELITLNNNETYTISCKSGYDVVAQAFDDNKALYYTSGTGAWVSSVTFTNIPYIAVAIKKTSDADITPEEIVNAGVQLKTSSTTYQLSLGDIELAQIGNYKDYIYKNEGKWYKHSEIGKKIFTGANDETWYKEDSPDYLRFNIRNISDMKQQASRQLCYSNYFKFNSVVTAHSVGTMFAYWTNDGSIYLYPETDITTVELFKQWLSTHNTEVYYMLETPTDTEITDTTLINQLEAWYNAQSIKGTTIIEGNGDLPMIIKVRGLKGE